MHPQNLLIQPELDDNRLNLSRTPDWSAVCRQSTTSGNRKSRFYPYQSSCPSSISIIVVSLFYINHRALSISSCLISNCELVVAPCCLLTAATETGWSVIWSEFEGSPNLSDSVSSSFKRESVYVVVERG